MEVEEARRRPLERPELEFLAIKVDEFPRRRVLPLEVAATGEDWLFLGVVVGDDNLPSTRRPFARVCGHEDELPLVETVFESGVHQKAVVCLV